MTSANPIYAVTPKSASAAAPGFDTSLTGPSTTATVLTAGTAGSKVEEIVIQGTGTTVAGVLNIWLHDGSNYSLVDQVLITAVTSSTTAVAFRQVRQYQNLVLTNNSWTLRISHTVTGNDTNKLRVTAYYADF
jgi:hypothetical protein